MKSKTDMDETKRIMGALVRMPPKQHGDMKLSKAKRRKAASLSKKKKARKAILSPV